MNLRKQFSFVAVIILALLFTTIGWSNKDHDSFSYDPAAGIFGKKRIAYYQGGPSTNYYPYLVATVKGLIDLGWIENKELPAVQDNDTRRLWNWLVKHVKSDLVEFVADGYYTADWDTDSRAKKKQAIIDRLSFENDIDLIIAMGTWAGKDLANNQHDTPTMIMSSTDPLGAGIIASNDDSGYDHVFARVDPHRFERQVTVFHAVVGFRKVGVAYQNSPLGRSYAALDQLEKISKDKGFEVVSCFTMDDVPDRELAGESVIKCFERLASEVDALYVVAQNGVNSNTIPELVSIANKYRIPTFSQQGSEEVRYGFLLSVSRAHGFTAVGRFLAISMAKIFNGATPREIGQVFEERTAIAINLKTAELIGFYLYADVLAAADVIYREIEIP